MEKSDLDNLSLQDVRLMLALERTRSVSRAAELLDISQSSASYGLDKLRRAFADPLFIRQGQGMKPTWRGVEIIALLADMVPKLEALTQPVRFDPVNSHRVFVVAATGYEIHAVLARLHHSLRVMAPNTRLHIVDLDSENARNKLYSEWDILMSPSIPTNSGAMCRKLFEDDYVTVFDPTAQTPPSSLEAFVAAPHAVVAFDVNSKTIVDDALAQQGLSRQVSLITAGFDHLPVLMRGTPLLSTLPSRFMPTLFEGFDYVVPPFSLPPMSLYMIWSEARGADPAHQWFRQQLLAAANDPAPLNPAPGVAP